MATAKQESLTKQESSNRLEIASQPDDRRQVKNWPMVRILLLVRDSIVEIFFVAWFFSAIEELGLETGWLPLYTLFGGWSLALVAALLIPFLIKRYREQNFEPIDLNSFSLLRYRQTSDKTLDEAGFRIVETFSVLGTTIRTRCEVYGPSSAKFSTV